MTQDIRSKYNEYRQKNYTESQIHRHIIQDGFSTEEIDNLYNQLDEQKEVQLKKIKKSNIPLKIFLYVAGTILIGLGGVLMMSGGSRGAIACFAGGVGLFLKASYLH